VGRPEDGRTEGRDERRLLFVFDKANGSLIRQIELPATSAGAPMTYLHQGVQYVVLAVGIAEGSELVALRLSPPQAPGPAKP
jgi:quinoprotein glucose dehydrogenase